MKHFIYALSTFAGTLIGVGFFSLPYLASKFGFLLILLELVVLGIIVIIIHLLLSEIVVATPGVHMFPGYAKYYLGNVGGIIALIASVLGIFSALLAYLIVGGGFLQNLLANSSSASPFFYILIYFALGSFLIFFEIKSLGKSEFFLLSLFFLILIIFSVFGFPKVQSQNLAFLEIKISYIPIGAILFSLWATSIIPSLKEFFSIRSRKNVKDSNQFKFGSQKKSFACSNVLDDSFSRESKNSFELDKKGIKNLRLVIILGIILGMICYFVFTMIILGISGAETSRDAILGLAVFLPRKIIFLGLIFGFLATFTSFIGLGFALKKILSFDLKLNKSFAWAITCFVPLLAYIIGIHDFIKVIGLAGSVLLGLEGVLIIVIYIKMKRYGPLA